MTTTPPTHDGAAPAGEADVLRRACRDLGLADGVADALLARLLDPAAADRSAHDPMARREAEMMQLLKSPTPDRLVHDLRNVLNEVALLKAAAEL